MSLDTIRANPGLDYIADLALSESHDPTPTLLDDTTFTATSQETLSSTILASYITSYAEAKGHRAVIFCDTATKLAAKTLAAISKGQGWNLGEIVGAGDIPIAGSGRPEDFTLASR